MKLRCLGLMSMGALSFALPTSGMASASCPAPDHEVLELSLSDFNGEQGWRRWEDPDCADIAANMIAQYRERNVATLRDFQSKGLEWHQAQATALAGDEAKALTLFREVRSAALAGASLYYYDATIAFLEHDLAAFNVARAGMMAQPAPEGFEKAADAFVAQYGEPRPQWPMNVDVVDALSRCFGQTYRVAYAGCKAH